MEDISRVTPFSWNLYVSHYFINPQKCSLIPFTYVFTHNFLFSYNHYFNSIISISAEDSLFFTKFSLSYIRANFYLHSLTQFHLVNICSQTQLLSKYDIWVLYFYAFTSIIRGVSLVPTHVENGHPLERPGALLALPEGPAIVCGHVSRQMEHAPKSIRH